MHVPIVTFVHVPLWSTSHWIVQALPASKVCPGPGAVGVRSASTCVTNARGRTTKASVEVILTAKRVDDQRKGQLPDYLGVWKGEGSKHLKKKTLAICIMAASLRLTVA